MQPVDNWREKLTRAQNPHKNNEMEMNKAPGLMLVLVFILTACSQITGQKQTLRPKEPPDDIVIANINLAVEYMRIGEYEKALEKLERAKIAAPDFHGTYNIYGILYQQLGERETAEKNFKKSLKLDPADSGTMNNYGRFLCSTGRADEARKIFQKAIENPLYDTPEIAITNAATCAKLNGKIPEAEKFYKKALAINPEMPSALLQMSQINFDKGDVLSARGYYQRYIEIASQTAVSLWLGIQIESRLGDKDAVSSYALLLRNNFPNSNEARLLDDSGAR